MTMIWEWIRFISAALIMALGIFVVCVSVYGVFRFKYVLNRMHISALGDTLGLSLVLLSLIIISGFTFTSLKLLLIIAFFWLTSPVSAHLISRLEVITNEDYIKKNVEFGEGVKLSDIEED